MSFPQILLGLAGAGLLLSILHLIQSRSSS